MQLKNTESRYGMMAITFHWIMALFIIGMLFVGLTMINLSRENPIKFPLYDLHKSFGVLILMLVILRLSWRLANIVPILPFSMPTWQKTAAKISHFLLYLAMFLMPITGYLLSTAGGHPVKFFGLFTLPALIQENKAVSEFFGECHEVIAYSLIALLVIHIGAAFQHYFIRKDDVLTRMLP